MVDAFRLIAERKIQEAMESGAFENLAGAGQPLDLEENPFEEPSLRMAHRLLRNNGFAPAWILESKDIDAAAWRLRADFAAGRLAPEDYRREAAALNRRIAMYNLKAPGTCVHKLPIPL